MTDRSVVLPGDRLCSVDDAQPGPGTYVNASSVFASLVGIRTESASPNAADTRPVISVTRDERYGSAPMKGSFVLAKVTRVTQRLAGVDIVCVSPTLQENFKPLRDSFSGTIKKEDVRATEIDKVDLHQSFRLGDVVRAQVTSLGDARSYYLSTAGNELGVVFARSEAGHDMVPVSWEQMQCPITEAVENRKVAKQTAAATC